MALQSAIKWFSKTQNITKKNTKICLVGENLSSPFYRKIQVTFLLCSCGKNKYE